MTRARFTPARERALGTCLLAMTLLSACNDQTPPPSAARFERPNRVAFVCVEEGQPLPLAACAATANQSSTTRDEFALVTQSTRGELAAVNLDTRTVLDNRRDIPGFTFVPVGETPIAIAVPPRHPEYTFVANFGSRDIRILETAALVGPLQDDPTLAVFRIQTADGSAIAPTDMLLSPDEDGLIVAAPDAGSVFWLPLDFAPDQLPLKRCEGDDPSCPAGDVQGKVQIPLKGSIDRIEANPPGDITPSQYAQLCGSEPQGGELKQAEVPALPANIDTVEPRPIALAIDDGCEPDATCTRRVLVADEALPVIHALDLAVLENPAMDSSPDAALLDPLLTGVPTRAVVATPIVPATLEGGATKYVYAIDATDGSVLVMENGRILAVGEGSTRRSDRIDFSYGADAPAPAAATIEVISPGYIAESPWLADCDARNPSKDPGVLSGVFLAAALTDGSMRIVDIHDMELRQPDGSDMDPCRACTDRDLPLVVRHQPRLDVTDPQTLTPQGALDFVVDGVAFDVRDNGTSPTPFAPRLSCIACDGDLTPVMPERATDSGAAGEGAGATDSCAVGQNGLLCAPTRGHGANDRWNAVFEGTIPGTIGGNGRFIEETSTGAPEFTLEVNPCLAGVLGNEDVAAALPEGCTGAPPVGDPEATALRGDQLVILTRPLSGARLREAGEDDPQVVARCEALSAMLASGQPPLLAFEIRRAYADKLVLRKNLVSPIVLPAALDYTLSSLADITACMPGTPIAYAIRSLGSFTVRGSQTGYQHRVHANDANRCVVDPDADPLLQGRAAFGCPFRNQEVQFQLSAPDMDQTLEAGIELRAQAVSRAIKLAMQSNVAGVVPVELRWNPIDQQVYMVDINALGLVPIRLDPLPVTPAFAFN